MATYLSDAVRYTGGYESSRLRRRIPVICMMGMILLAACSNIEKSNLAAERAEVHESSFERGFETGEISDKDISNIAHHYRRYGKGPAFVTVTYPSEEQGEQSFTASQSGAETARRLREQGLEHVNMDVLPHDTEGDAKSLTVISYKQLHATGPSGCRTSQGYRTGNPTSDREKTKKYKLGCNIETMLARQVTRPGDLLGEDYPHGTKPSGRRAANIINRYESGEPNEPLEGFTASDVGASQ